MLNNETCPHCKIPLREYHDYITCPTCQTSYHEKCWEENGGCTLCDVSAGSPGATPGKPSNWYLYHNNRNLGPLTWEQLCSHPGIIPDDLVWNSRLPDWIRADQLPDLPLSSGLPEKPEEKTEELGETDKDAALPDTGEHPPSTPEPDSSSQWKSDEAEYRFAPEPAREQEPGLPGQEKAIPDTGTQPPVTPEPSDSSPQWKSDEAEHRFTPEPARERETGLPGQEKAIADTGAQPTATPEPDSSSQWKSDEAEYRFAPEPAREQETGLPGQEKAIPDTGTQPPATPEPADSSPQWKLGGASRNREFTSEQAAGSTGTPPPDPSRTEQIIDHLYTEQPPGPSPGHSFLERYEEDFYDEHAELARRYSRRMIYGVLWILSGLIAAAATYFYIADREIVYYIVAGGAILLGVIDFFRGLFGRLKYR